MKTMNLIAAGLLAAGLLCGCSADEDADIEPGYTQISQEEAREMMNSDDSYIIADVRTAEEYEESHIPGAINIPVEHLEDLADDLLPEREEIILIYCRSGNRSKQAAEILAGLGYTNLYEFGGITTWPYETVSGKLGTGRGLALGESKDLNENGISFIATGYHDEILEAVIENHSGETITYGTAYTLDILENGEFRQMEWKNEPVWIMIAFELEDGGSEIISRDLSMIDNLGPGTYRLHVGDCTTEFTLVAKE